MEYIYSIAHIELLEQIAGRIGTFIYLCGLPLGFIALVKAFVKHKAKALNGMNILGVIYLAFNIVTYFYFKELWTLLLMTSPIMIWGLFFLGGAISCITSFLNKKQTLGQCAFILFVLSIPCSLLILGGVGWAQSHLEQQKLENNYMAICQSVPFEEIQQTKNNKLIEHCRQIAIP